MMQENSSVGISKLVYRLPEHSSRLEQLAEADRLNSAASVMRDFGFGDCFFADDSDAVVSLMIASGKQLLADADLTAADLDSLFLYSGLGAAPASEGDNLSLFRYPLGQAQYELDLGAVPAMALAQRGCCGLLAAVALAARLLNGGNDAKRYSLLLVGDALPAGGKREIMYNLMSDAAGALLVERDSPRNRIVHYHEQVQPYYWDTPERENEVLAAYFPLAQRVIATALEQAGLSVADVRWFVPHNVSLRSWRILGRLLNIPDEKIWTNNIARTGHTVSCDHIINLVDMAQAGALNSGDYLVLFTFGFGASWSCLILQH